MAKRSMPGQGGTEHDIIVRMKAKGPYMGDQVAKCHRQIRTLNKLPRKRIDLCLIDSATYAAFEAGRDLKKEFQAYSAEKAWLRFLQNIPRRVWVDAFPVLVDWQNGVVARDGHEEYCCLKDVEQFLYVKDNHGKFVLKSRSELRSDITTDSLGNGTDKELDLGEAPETVRRYLLKVRLRQDAYRDDLIELWGRCSVTGCRNKSLLRASHIKPWSVSNGKERVDPFNGLLLTPALDLLFDKGLISFSDSGRILLSTDLDQSDLLMLGIHKNMKIQGMHDENKPYLREHRRLHGFTA